MHTYTLTYTHYVCIYLCMYIMYKEVNAFQDQLCKAVAALEELCCSSVAAFVAAFVAALEELCSSSVAATVSNVTSISFRIFVFILQHPAVLSLSRPPARALSRPMHRSLWTHWKSFWGFPRKETLQATLVMQAGLALLQQSKRDSTYAYTQSQHTSTHARARTLTHTHSHTLCYLMVHVFSLFFSFCMYVSSISLIRCFIVFHTHTHTHGLLGFLMLLYTHHSCSMLCYSCCMLCCIGLLILLYTHHSCGVYEHQPSH